MLKNLVGKDVTLIVGFSSYTVDGGSSPAYYTGRITDVDDDFVKIDITKSDVLTGRESALKWTTGSGSCIVNQKYIISIFIN